MGLIGFVCPAGSPTAGNRNKVEFCLGRCPHPCVAEPLLAAIHHANHVNYHKGAYLSASMLAGSNCMRRVFYERYDDDGYFELARNAWWPFRGTIAHKVVEDRGPDSFHLTTYMQEMRMAVDLTFPNEPAPVFDTNGDWTGEVDRTRPLVITCMGTCDCYSPWKRKLLDLKTMADAKARMVVGGKQDESWVVQTNIYGWLIANTKITDEHRAEFKAAGLPDLEGEYFPAPEAIHIQGLSMQELPLTGQPYVAQRTSDVVQIPGIPVFPLAVTERVIRDRALEWYKTLVLKIKPPPVDKGREWMCRGCTFNGEVIDGERCFPKKEREETGLWQEPPAAPVLTLEDEPHNKEAAPAKKTRKKAKAKIEFG